mgnify:CR=1 FL=1|jgi:YgiT-type zinc finger domain-containing protein
MKCVICKHGETAPGKVTVSLTRGETTLIFKGVPADVCENCSEYFLSEEVSKKLLVLGNEAVAKGAEIEVLRYAA